MGFLPYLHMPSTHLNNRIAKPPFLRQSKWEALDAIDQRYCRQAILNNAGAMVICLVFIWFNNFVGFAFGRNIGLIILSMLILSNGLFCFLTKYYAVGSFLVPLFSSLSFLYLFIHYSNTAFIMVIVPHVLAALIDFRKRQVSIWLASIHLLVIVAMILVKLFRPGELLVSQAINDQLTLAISFLAGLFCTILIYNFRSIEKVYEQIIQAQKDQIKVQAQRTLGLQQEEHKVELRRTLRKIENLNLINDSKVKMQDKIIDDLTDALKGDNPESAVRNIIAAIRAQQQGQDQQYSLRQQIDQLDSSFFERIQNSFPQLSKTEREIAAFLKLKLSTKEISHLRNTSESAVFSTKSRIRRKLNLSEEQGLEQFFEQF